MGLRLALAEPGAHRSWIRTGGTIELGDRPGETGLRHMAEGAGLVSVDRKILVKQQQLAEQLDLLNLVVRRCGNTLESLGLNRVDLRLHAGDLAQSRR